MFANEHGLLAVRGGTLCNAHSIPVVLRGVSLFWSQWMGQFYNEPALRWLRDDWRINVVRAALGVHQGGYLEHPARELAKITAAIEAASSLGLYVIVDWHVHEPETDIACKFFGDVARRYSATPNLIFEVWNEPAPQLKWREHIKPHHEQVIGHIRDAGAPHLVIAGTGCYSQYVDVAATDPLADPNVAYALHFYCSSHGARLRARAERALATGAALFVSEWGVSEASGNGAIDPDSLQAWRFFMRAHGLSHVSWSICDKEETSAALRPGADPFGNWAPEDLTEAGNLIRTILRNGT